MTTYQNSLPMKGTLAMLISFVHQDGAQKCNRTSKAMVVLMATIFTKRRACGHVNAKTNPDHVVVAMYILFFMPELRSKTLRLLHEYVSAHYRARILPTFLTCFRPIPYVRIKSYMCT